MSTTGRDLFSLSGKTALVTGGCGFLGRFFCRGLARAGANVAIIDLKEKESGDLARALKAECGVEAVGIGCDITDPAAVADMVKKVGRALPAVGILVNSAAYSSPDRKALCAAFEDYTVEEWEKMFAANSRGAFLCTQAVGRQMLAARRAGSIIFIASIYGVLGTDHRIYEEVNRLTGARMNNPAAYSAAKGSTIALMRHLAAAWGDKGIRVNALCPGGVKNNHPEEFVRAYSSRVPMARMAEPEEMVGPLLFLAADASGYITGQVIMADGGLSAW